MVKISLQKCILVSIGALSVGLAIVGIFIPVLPTTPLLLLAAACFVRSSDRLYTWLITHKWLGPYIRNYREHKAITRKAKITTLVLLWGTIGYTAFGVISYWPLRILLMFVAIGVTIHVLSMRTLTKDMFSASEIENDDGSVHQNFLDGSESEK